MDLDQGANLKVDHSKVPSYLQFMIPLVERWGFRSLDDQDVFVRKMQKQRPGEIEEFNRIVDQNRTAIREWRMSELSFLDKHVSEFTDEDRGHPYFNFLDLLKIREITGTSSQPDPEELAMKQSLRNEIHRENYQVATLKADDAFRNKDYRAYLNILAPFEDLLTSTQRKKIALAAAKNMHL